MLNTKQAELEKLKINMEIEKYMDKLKRPNRLWKRFITYQRRRNSSKYMFDFDTK